jgi:hypothetical protein
VLQTGNLKLMTQGPHAEMMRIYKENEILSQGGTVKSLLTDNHPLFIKERMSLFADAQLLNSDEPGSQTDTIVANVLANIKEHIDLWKQLSADRAGTLRPFKYPEHRRRTSAERTTAAAGPWCAKARRLPRKGAAAGLNGGKPVRSQNHRCHPAECRRPCTRRSMQINSLPASTITVPKGPPLLRPKPSNGPKAAPVTKAPPKPSPLPASRQMRLSRTVAEPSEAVDASRREDGITDVKPTGEEPPAASRRSP